MRILFTLSMLCLAAPAYAQCGPDGMDSVCGPARKSAGKALVPYTDANVAANVYWNGTALQDVKGNAWAMTGTVPQVAASGGVPAGAGVFSDSNYYSIASPSFAETAPYVDCAAWIQGASVGSDVLVSFNGSAAQSRSAGANFQFYADGSTAVTSLNSIATSAVNVACWGISSAGTTEYVKLNTGTTVTATISTHSTGKVWLGRYSTTGNAAVNEKLIWFMHAPGDIPSDTLFTTIITAALAWS